MSTKTKNTKPTRRPGHASKQMVCEIRALDGGAEAEQFAGELLDSVESYLRGEGLDYKTDVSGRGVRTVTVCGFDRLLASLAGVHRVQRQPGGGRGKRHSSTVSLAVLEGTDPTSVVEIPADELEVSWYRGSGPGGQHRNTTEQAVRLRHLPTGMVVTVDGRDRPSNLRAAMAEMESRLGQQAAARKAAETHQLRTSQTGTPTDGGKDFTWNWQRSEVVDHRDGRSWRLRDAQRGRWRRTR